MKLPNRRLEQFDRPVAVTIRLSLCNPKLILFPLVRSQSRAWSLPPAPRSMPNDTHDGRSSVRRARKRAVGRPRVENVDEMLA